MPRRSVSNLPNPYSPVRPLLHCTAVTYCVSLSLSLSLPLSPWLSRTSMFTLCSSSHISPSPCRCCLSCLVLKRATSLIKSVVVYALHCCQPLPPHFQRIRKKNKVTQLVLEFRKSSMYHIDQWLQKCPETIVVTYVVVPCSSLSMARAEETLSLA